jgi:hypothetical protein
VNSIESFGGMTMQAITEAARRRPVRRKKKRR